MAGERRQIMQNDPMIGSHQYGNPSLAHDNKPVIFITEQPKSRGMRFRYQCEGRSAGAIPGELSTSEKRSYPSIRLENFNGPSAIVVVSCVTKDDPPRPHPHSLVGKDCKQGVCTVKLKGTNIASFPNLGIQCCTRRQIQDMLKTREQIRVDPWGTGYFNNINQMDLNTVRLAFQAFLPDSKGKYTQIVAPVVSSPIYDKKAVNDLVICRLSKQAGSVRGGDEVFILCEKVSKDDIQVRFFEEDPSGGQVWEAFGYFGQQDVHRQYAIVFKTPPYQDLNISQPANVYIQLRRPSDDGVSDPKPFQYIPDDPDPDFIQRKRKRKIADFQFLGHLMDSNGNDPPDNKKVVRERLLAKQGGAAADNSQYPATVLASGTVSGISSALSTAPGQLYSSLQANMAGHAATANGIPATNDTMSINERQFQGYLLDTIGIGQSLPSLPSLPSLSEDHDQASQQLIVQGHHNYLDIGGMQTVKTDESNDS